jgi:hypothetical protein
VTNTLAYCNTFAIMLGKLYSIGLLLGIVEKQKNHLKKLSFMKK